MSEPLHDEPLHDEVLDGLLVLPDEPSGAMFPAPASRALIGPLAGPVQTVAVAAGGFVAGAALLGLVHRRHSRRAALAGGARSTRRVVRGGHSARELVEIVGSRSLLVDVHLLGVPRRDR